MNKKGQNLGSFLLVFITVVVGLALVGAAALEVGRATTSYLHNDTADAVSTTMPTNGTYLDLTGQDLLDTPTVMNASGGGAVGTGNYTMGTRVSPTTGVKTVYIFTRGTGLYAGELVNLTYTYGPEGYIDNAGGRAVAGIIIIFFVLGIAVVVLEPTLRSGLLEMVNR